MKRGIVSVLWGAFLDKDEEMCEELKERFDYDFSNNPKHPIAIRRNKIEKNIRSFSKQPYAKDATVYVYGRENYDTIIKHGLKAVLVDESPYMFTPVRGIYLHKLHAYKQIMQDFDEVVILDFDMIQVAPFPVDFWEILNKKDVFQSSIHIYKKPRITHREGRMGNKLISSGAFVYMRAKDAAERIWEHNRVNANRWSCEPAFSCYADELSDGWKGVDEYYDRFEPMFYRSKRTPYRDQEKYPQIKCFHHGHFTNRPIVPGWYREQLAKEKAKEEGDQT
jgi:hypothetical protein